jgi:hypothetical protein
LLRSESFCNGHINRNLRELLFSVDFGLRQLRAKDHMDYYWEAAVVGTPRFPEAVHFVIASFPDTFGTPGPRGRRRHSTPVVIDLWSSRRGSHSNLAAIAGIAFGFCQNDRVASG